MAVVESDTLARDKQRIVPTALEDVLEQGLAAQRHQPTAQFVARELALVDQANAVATRRQCVRRGRTGRTAAYDNRVVGTLAHRGRTLPGLRMFLGSSVCFSARMTSISIALL